MGDRYWAHKIKRAMPKIWFFFIIYFACGVFLPFILMWIFGIKNLWFILLVWGLQLFYYYVIQNIGDELYWISKALMDPKNLTMCRAEHGLYEYLNSFLREKLQYGMSFNEILEIAKKDNKEDRISYECLERLKAIHMCYFENQKKKAVKFVIKGFGERMPTPKFIFKFKDNKLVYWHDTSWSSFSWV